MDTSTGTMQTSHEDNQPFSQRTTNKQRISLIHIHIGSKKKKKEKNPNSSQGGGKVA